jgi:hypothetical protein
MKYLAVIFGCDNQKLSKNIKILLPISTSTGIFTGSLMALCILIVIVLCSNRCADLVTKKVSVSQVNQNQGRSIFKNSVSLNLCTEFAVGPLFVTYTT